MFLTPRTLIASAALWCVAGITAGTLRTVEDIAPPPAAESPVAILAKADRLPLIPREAITDRWPALSQEPAAVRAAARTDEPQTVAATVSAGRPHIRNVRKIRIADRADVCARHGMRKVITRGGRSWRCRR